MRMAAGSDGGRRRTTTAAADGTRSDANLDFEVVRKISLSTFFHSNNTNIYTKRRERSLKALIRQHTLLSSTIS